MKAIFLVLVVCIASSMAAKPISNLISLVENHFNVSFAQLTNLFGNFLQSLKPRGLDLTFFNQLLQGVIQNAMGSINGLLSNLALSFLGGNRNVADLQAESKDLMSGIFTELLNNLTNLLQGAAGQVLGSILGGKRGLADILSLINPILSQVQPILGVLQTQLGSIVGNFISNLVHGRGIIDYLSEVFNIGPIFSVISQIGGSLQTQFMNIATQLLFAGQSMWAQAIPVFNNLVAELQSHAGNAVQLVSQAVLQLTGVLAAPKPRGFMDTILNSLGLNVLVDMASSIGSQLYGQLVSIATQILFHGQNMWQQAIPVFQNLAAELTSHAGNAVQLVSQAVLQLTGVLANPSVKQDQRFIMDILNTLGSALGLNQILSQIQNVGAGLLAQFTSIAMQVLTHGQTIYQAAIPVFQNLAAELTSHAGNAVQLVSQAVLQLTSVLNSGRTLEVRFSLVDTVMDMFNLKPILATLQTVGSSLYAQFVGIATQLLFAGQNMWTQAIPVFNNLVAELQSHAGNAVQLVSQAVLQLTGVLASSGSRVSKASILDMVFSAFGLDSILSTIQSVGSTLFSQFATIATQVLLHGQNMWALAQPVFNNLVAELTSHAGNAVQLVSQAVLQLTGVLATPSF